MKKSFAFLSGALLLVLFSCSNPKLIIESGKEKHKLKVNSSIAVTMNGETYAFDESCKNTCRNCDTLFQNSRWWVDSLGTDALVLRYEHTFKFDTITNKEFKARSKVERRTHVYKVLVYEKKPIYVYKTPVDVERKQIRFDQMESITYSDRPRCYRGTPIKAIFHNPNKIRKIVVPGAEFKLKKKD